MKFFKNWYQILYTVFFVFCIIAIFYLSVNFELNILYIFALLFLMVITFSILYGFGEIIYYLKFNEKTIICKNCNTKNDATRENCYMCGKKLE